MAMFPTHIKTSTVLGIGYGLVTCVGGGVPPWTALVGTGLCSVAGMLPDIDSGPGIPLREITTFLAAVVPTMLISRMISFSMNQEMIILVGAVLYLLIRFGLAHFLRHYTVHRGMFHSFPSMAIFAELTYLLFYGESMAIRLYMVTAVCIGFFSHLILDEIYSVDWKGEPRLKSSFGTACKFFGPVPWANLSCYTKLIVLTLCVMKDPAVFQKLSAGKAGQAAKSVEDNLANESDGAKNSKVATSITDKLRQAASYLTGNHNSPSNGTTNNDQQYNPQNGAQGQNNWAGAQGNGYPANYNYQPQQTANNYPQNGYNGRPGYANQGNYNASAGMTPNNYNANPGGAPYGGQPNHPATNNANMPMGGYPANGYPNGNGNNQGGGYQNGYQASGGYQAGGYQAGSYQGSSYQGSGYQAGGNPAGNVPQNGMPNNAMPNGNLQNYNAQGSAAVMTSLPGPGYSPTGNLNMNAAGMSSGASASHHSNGFPQGAGGSGYNGANSNASGPNGAGSNGGFNTPAASGAVAPGPEASLTPGGGSFGSVNDNSAPRAAENPWHSGTLQ